MVVIEKRLVQWYAHDAGVDLDITERAIFLRGWGWILLMCNPWMSTKFKG